MPKVLVWLFSVIHFQKYFSPQPFLYRISLRKKTGGLTKYDFVLYFQNVYFPTLLGKLNLEQRRYGNIYFEKLSVKLIITPYCIFQTVWEKRIQKLLRFNWSSQHFAKLLCCGWFLHLLHGEYLSHCWITNPKRNVKFRWRRPMHVRFVIKNYIHSGNYFYSY